MTEEVFVRPPSVDGPIQVFDTKGTMVLEVGEEVHQADGIPRAMALCGTLYDTVVFAYQAQHIEDIEDIGYVVVLKAFKAWAENMIQDEDFYSIEWRVPPMLDGPNEYHASAIIVDSETGEHRKGLELRWAIQLRCRLIVHKRSTRPASGVVGAKTERSEPVWLKAPEPAKKIAA